MIASAAAIALSSAPQAAFAGDIEAGQKIFEANCAVCHVGGMNNV